MTHGLKIVRCRECSRELHVAQNMMGTICKNCWAKASDHLTQHSLETVEEGGPDEFEPKENQSGAV